MKILEAQSAVLTNYEVFEHLHEQIERRKQLKKDVRHKLMDEARQKKAPEKMGNKLRDVPLSESEKKDIENTVKRYCNRPGNLEAVVREILEYFNELPSPLYTGPDPKKPLKIPYKQDSIKTILERLRPFDLTKAEILMIMNLRPVNGAVLGCVVEEMEAGRYSEEQQVEMVQIIAEVLGKPNSEADRQAMSDSKEAHKEKSRLANHKEQVDEEMEDL